MKDLTAIMLVIIVLGGIMITGMKVSEQAECNTLKREGREPQGYQVEMCR